MGYSLLDNVRETFSKSKTSGMANSTDSDVMYPTNFVALDFLNGTTVYVNGNGKNFSYKAVGIVDGSSNTIIGRSGSGKSTLIMQIAGNIVRPFIKKDLPTGLFIDDIESSLGLTRKRFLLGLTNEEAEKYVVVRNTGITTENVLERILAIKDEKINNRKHYEYDTGLYDVDGNRIFKLVPTVYVIDSIAMLLPENLAEQKDLAGNMDSSAIAKANTMFAKQVVQACKEANIILMTINHILDNINISFIPKQSQLSGLQSDERLSGGKVSIYLANNMFRVDDFKTLKAKDGFKIDGSVVKISVLKSRTNASKRSVPLIFNKTEGRFDELLSIFQLLKDEGRIQGSGVSSYLSGAKDVKFSQGTFKETLENSPELQKAVGDECEQILTGYLSETRGIDENVSTVNDSLMSRLIGTNTD